MDLRVAAYAVVTDDEDRILLARWNEGREPAWTMPGGGIDPGEDPEDAVRRELVEETGYTIRVDKLLGINSRVIRARRRIGGGVAPLHTIRIVYRATVIGGELRFETGGSTDMAGWFTTREIAGLTKVKLVRIALEMAEREG